MASTDILKSMSNKSSIWSPYFYYLIVFVILFLGSFLICPGVFVCLFLYCMLSVVFAKHSTFSRNNLRPQVMFISSRKDFHLLLPDS